MVIRNGLKWSKEETILALDLYLKISFSKASKSNKDVVQLANIIGRTPASVAMKVCNLASFDPIVKQRNKSGLSNASRLDKIVFEEYSCNLEELANQVNKILKNQYNQSVELPIGLKELPDGIYKETIIRARIGQEYFRRVVLNIYNHKCCITGLSLDELLIASHIKPWAISDEHTERTNPSNGLCLNAFHDKAFDRGFITFDDRFRMIISDKLKDAYMDEDTRIWIQSYKGKELALPNCFKPSKVFLEYHNDVIFLR